jgi:hypothetical protein
MRRIQILDDPRDGSRSRVAAVAQIEDKSRIAKGFLAEPGRRNVTAAHEFFNFSE